MTKVEVQVYSKNITLPQNKVTLSAFVIPEAKPPNSYKYEWNLITGIIIIVNIKKIMLLQFHEIFCIICNIRKSNGTWHNGK